MGKTSNDIHDGHTSIHFSIRGRTVDLLYLNMDRDGCLLWRKGLCISKRCVLVVYCKRTKMLTAICSQFWNYYSYVDIEEPNPSNNSSWSRQRRSVVCDCMESLWNQIFCFLDKCFIIVKFYILYEAPTRYVASYVFADDGFKIVFWLNCVISVKSL